MAGRFITIEGPDGSGKTSLMNEIEKRLKKEKINFIRTREPGGIGIAEEIRSIILNPKNTEMDPRTEALLYAASRRQHLVEKVVPALKAGKHVLCERFIDSSLAYQGAGRKLGIEEVYQLNQFAIDESMPNLTIFIDIEPEVGIERIHQNRSKKDRLDMESLAFHRRVYSGYQEVIKRFQDRIKVIDGSAPLNEVIDAAYEQIINEIKG